MQTQGAIEGSFQLPDSLGYVDTEKSPQLLCIKYFSKIPFLAFTVLSDSARLLIGCHCLKRTKI